MQQRTTKKTHAKPQYLAEYKGFLESISFWNL